jgi:hypothetical protein
MIEEAIFSKCLNYLAILDKNTIIVYENELN